MTQLFAHRQLGRIVSPVRSWRWLLASRWRRLALIAIIFILYLIVSPH
ncbi:MAG: hypothetical protein ACREV7_00940 [Steroidobacteraceae bacterium]